jgi:hypothetical protein
MDFKRWTLASGTYYFICPCLQLQRESFSDIRAGNNKPGMKMRYPPAGCAAILMYMIAHAAPAMPQDTQPATPAILIATQRDDSGTEATDMQNQGVDQDNEVPKEIPKPFIHQERSLLPVRPRDFNPMTAPPAGMTDNESLYPQQQLAEPAGMSALYVGLSIQIAQLTFLVRLLAAAAIVSMVFSFAGFLYVRGSLKHMRKLPDAAMLQAQAAPQDGAGMRGAADE